MIVVVGTKICIAECLCGTKLYCGDGGEGHAVKYAEQNGWKIDLDQAVEICPQCLFQRK